jgi:hypothetical protein
LLILINHQPSTQPNDLEHGIKGRGFGVTITIPVIAPACDDGSSDKERKGPNEGNGYPGFCEDWFHHNHTVKARIRTIANGRLGQCISHPPQSTIDWTISLMLLMNRTTVWSIGIIRTVWQTVV